jgi:dsRNA-specific ribonuclease
MNRVSNIDLHYFIDLNSKMKKSGSYLSATFKAIIGALYLENDEFNITEKLALRFLRSRLIKELPVRESQI